MDFAKVLAKELSLDEKHVQNVLNLILSSFYHPKYIYLL